MGRPEGNRHLLLHGRVQAGDTQNRTNRGIGGRTVHEVKITVLKCLAHPELVEEYMGDEVREARLACPTCGMLQEGQQLVLSDASVAPEGFCAGLGPTFIARSSRSQPAAIRIRGSRPLALPSLVARTDSVPSCSKSSVGTKSNANEKPSSLRIAASMIRKSPSGKELRY